jgi:hypothetical protein
LAAAVAVDLAVVMAAVRVALVMAAAVRAAENTNKYVK